MGSGRRQRDSAKEQFWRQMHRRQRASGLSVREFCLREGLSRSSFRNWRPEIARRDGESTGRSGVARKPRRVSGSLARTDEERRLGPSGGWPGCNGVVCATGSAPCSIKVAFFQNTAFFFHFGAVFCSGMF